MGGITVRARCRIWLSFLLSIAIAPIGPPVAADEQEKAPQAESNKAYICDRIGQKDIEIIVREVNDSTKELMPAKYRKKADSTDVELVTFSPKNYAPRAIKSKNYKILIPAQFVKLQCDAIYIQMISMVKDVDGNGAVKSIYDECISERQDRTMCIYASVISVSQILQEKWVPGEGVPELVHNWTRQALQMTLLHEYAHIVLGHVDNPVSYMEISADRFAGIYSILNGSVSIAGYSVFSSLMVADSDSFYAGIHQSNVCRAKNINILMSKFQNRVFPLIEWAFDDEGAGGDSLQVGMPVQNLLFLDQIREAEASTCLDLKEGWANFEYDLEKMEGIVKRLRLVDADGGGATPKRLRPLMEYAPKSEEGRYLRGRLIAGRMRAVRQEPGIDEAEYLTLSRQITSSRKWGDVSSGDYGALLSMEAFSRWALAPEGSDLSGIKSMARQGVYYNGDFALGYLYLARIEIDSGDCTSGKLAYQKTMSLLRDDATRSALDAAYSGPMAEKCGEK